MAEFAKLLCQIFDNLLFVLTALQTTFIVNFSIKASKAGSENSIISINLPLQIFSRVPISTCIFSRWLNRMSIVVIAALVCSAD